MRSFRFFCAIGAITAIWCTPIQADQLSDIKPTWRVGIAEFKPIHLSSENSYLSSSYPLLLMETLLSADIHLYSGEEINLYRELILERAAGRLPTLGPWRVFWSRRQQPAGISLSARPSNCLRGERHRRHSCRSPAPRSGT